MAQVTEVTLVDDLDGGKADETVAFSLDGKSFEIDLSAAHASQLRDAMASYIDAARRATAGGGRRSLPRVVSTQPKSNREENAAVRQWAQRNGYKVSERGRIPSEVLQAYADRDDTPAPAVVEEKPKRRTRRKAADAA